MTTYFNDYRLDNVYLCTTAAQRNDIMSLWQSQGIIPDADERTRRSHEVVVMVRHASGELAGVSSVGLAHGADQKRFYTYRMFLAPQHRVPYLMSAVTRSTCAILRDFPHPSGAVAGLVAVTENPKLMRPGTKREFQRIGFHHHSKTSNGLDCWMILFD